MNGFKKIRLPLGDKSYLQDVYVLLFKKGDRFILFDAGLNTEESFKALLHEIRGEGYELKDMETLIISHYHLDHCGLALRLQNMLSIPVYLHERDREILLFFKKHVEHYPERIKEFYCSYGVPPNLMENIKAELQVYKALILGPTDTLPLKEGDRFEIEEGHLEVIYTPGHTPGHISLFYPEKNILFGADFILEDEWPHGGIYPHTARYNPIKDYLKSLEKVKDLKPELIIPSHKNPIYEPEKRIDEAIGFMRKKIEEIYEILKKKGPLSLFQICDLVFKGYGDVISYFFLLSLSLGYMRYLLEEGICEEVKKGEITLFKAKG